MTKGSRGKNLKILSSLEKDQREKRPQEYKEPFTKNLFYITFDQFEHQLFSTLNWIYERLVLIASSGKYRKLDKNLDFS